VLKLAGEGQGGEPAGGTRMATVPPGMITGAPVAAVWGCGDMGAGEF